MWGGICINMRTTSLARRLGDPTPVDVLNTANDNALGCGHAGVSSTCGWRQKGGRWGAWAAYVAIFAKRACGRYRTS